MIDVQLIRVKSKNGLLSNSFEDSEEVIFDMAKKGYTFNGYLPIVIGSYGNILEYDLVFEKQN